MNNPIAYSENDETSSCEQSYLKSLCNIKKLSPSTVILLTILTLASIYSVNPHFIDSLSKIFFLSICPIIFLATKIIHINILETSCNPNIMQTLIAFLIFPLIIISFEISEFIISRKQNCQDTISPKNNNETYIKMVVHDFKNLLFVIGGYIDCGNLKEAKQKILEINDKFGEEKTDIPNVLNAVTENLISNKIKIAQKFGIEFNYKLEIIHDLQINDFDLCRILGNVIDNSIESCNKIKESRKKFINLEITSTINNLNIFIENSKLPLITLTSDKNNKHSHGIGLKSIDDVVNKYNGKKSITLDNEVFAFKITIPYYPENKIYA